MALFNFKQKKSRLGKTLPASPARYQRLTKNRLLFKKPLTKNQKQLPFKTISQKKKPSSRLKRIAVILMIGGFLIGSAYTALLSPIFMVRDYQVSLNTEQLVENDIAPLIEDYFYQNIFLLDQTNLANRLLDAYPEIETLSVTKKFPDKLLVKITTAAVLANLINHYDGGEKKFLINSKGILVNENKENFQLPYITLASEKPLELKTAALSSEKLKKTLQAIELFSAKINIKVIEAEYKRREREIHLRTERNFTVWLDSEQNIDKQIEKLRLSLPQLDIYHVNLAYIDLRIPGTNGEKIFFKRK